MKTRKITAIIISVFMLLSLIYIPASAEWDGTSVAASYAGGDGSESYPYVIETANELAKLAADVNNGTSYAGQYFKLGADIDLGDKNWTPIGQSKLPFSGIFDGCDHTISGLTSVDKSSQYAGLFGLVKDATIKNLTVSAEELICSKYSAAIVCNGNVSLTEGCVTGIYNCHVIRGDKLVGAQVGGIVGRNSQTGAGVNQFQIVGCTVSNVNILPPADADEGFTVSAFTNNFYGGIIGAAGSTTISGCSVTNCTITAGNSWTATYATAGGIIGVQGASSAPCYVYNCSVTKCSFVIPDTVSAPLGKADMGGIVGRASHVVDCLVKNCYAADNTFKSDYACALSGLLIGYNNEWVKYGNCYVCGEGDAIGGDALYNEYPVNTVAASDLNSNEFAAKLNEGNSKAVWITDGVAGHLTIDALLIAENECTTPDYEIPDETTAETTAAPVATTAQPETKPAVSETAAPVDTEAPAPETKAPDDGGNTTDPPAEEKKSGCGSAALSSVLVLVSVIGVAWVSKRK